MRSHRSHRLACLALLLSSAGGCGGHSSKPADARGALESRRDPSSAAGITADGQVMLRHYIDAAELPDLQWPSFSHYQSEVREFYDAFPSELPWVRGGKPTAQALAIIAALKNAEYKGLRPEDYDGPRWDARLAQIGQSQAGSESGLVRFDLALTVSAMRYISDLYIGRVNPRSFSFDLEIDHAKLDLSEFLRKEIVNASNTDTALESAEPPFPVYHRTEAALKTYIELVRKDDGELLPIPSQTVKPGDPYPGVSQLAKRLSLVGDIPGDAGQTGEAYEGALVDGVKHFQERHGLEPTGLIDRLTLRELNTPLGHRVNQLRLTMERIRWLPHEFARPPIVVNIPDFRLYAVDETFHRVFSMRVVLGRAYKHQTPVFASEIRSVIFRPYWDVPSSIVKEEFLLHLDEDPNYLAENSYQVVDKHGTVVTEGLVDERTKDQLRAGFLRIRQVPGPDNALGLLKFDIPSSYDVYMHGTPATALFSRSRRDFSHGCIRVENPVKLAEWVLRDMPEWDEEKIRAAMEGDVTFGVKLTKPLPVLIFYSTSVVMENGDVHFFDDIYGHDSALERVLDEGYPYREGAELPAGQ